MFKPLSKTCIAIMMMVAFIGQAMAYHTSFSIEASSDVHIVTEHVEQPQHIESADSDCQLTNCCDTNCCEIDCICPANACTSALYILNEPQMIGFMYVNGPIYSSINKQPISILSLPFRPPIFTS
ncbi:hypothetical protein [Pseudoalteromonas aurantia]|uniref:Uncharacterized protein n=1 Tax=Pseudoalteromonas aurantia TaxID=43654 RepID=A0A5S3V7H7_9GAMM|nr:hypothetical protein [Pseudoalteromonas aurantia]TMO67771.1 hypothetical protein CWC18_00045 [Pseudoalteromonas aurantia]TMO67809.1 hypothetical protein CWC19_12000 [Pseudoalteromonas aurantia]TMO78178.1 hypothetical protein CWC20_02105 [Pseudoalteromonas aurantia]